MTYTAESDCSYCNTKKETDEGGTGVNSYLIEYQIPHSGAGIVRESVDAASESQARQLIRTKFSGQDVQVLSSRQTHFGGGRDNQRDGKR